MEQKAAVEFEDGRAVALAKVTRAFNNQIEHRLRIAG
jgi:hypothetical protein